MAQMPPRPGPGGPPPNALPPPLERIPTVAFDDTAPPSAHTQENQPPPPPAHTYPCGCPYPGSHQKDCMWALWQQMKENYDQTKVLMTKFMTQVGGLQEAGTRGPECSCPAGCHGQDLGQAMGLMQMQGVTVPWGQPSPLPAFPAPTTMQPGGGSGSATLVDYSMENENRKLMEEQKRIKNTWAQFLNIFDMALDLANEQAQERWDTVQRRKEKQREEREQKKEEERQRRKELREQCMRDREEEEKEKEEKGKKEVKSEKPKKQSKKSEKTSAAAKEEPEAGPEEARASEEPPAENPPAEEDTEEAPAESPPAEEGPADEPGE